MKSFRIELLHRYGDLELVELCLANPVLSWLPINVLRSKWNCYRIEQTLSLDYNLQVNKLFSCKVFYHCTFSCYQQQHQPSFYGHYTGQPTLASTSSQELEDFVGAKFYSAHDGCHHCIFYWHISLHIKTLDEQCQLWTLNSGGSPDALFRWFQIISYINTKILLNCYSL